MKKIFTLLFMMLTGTAATITINGCFTKAESTITLHESDIDDLNGVTYHYEESDSARIMLDFYEETNRKKEVITLENDLITREYYFDGKRYRTSIKYTPQRREVLINSKKIGS